MSKVEQIATLFPLLLLSGLLAGCGSALNSNGLASSVASAGLHGAVHGGQQPVSGATIGLYAGSVAGYGGAVQNLLKTPVTTDANGALNITSDYTCTAGQQMYLTATGGNTGNGVNANSAVMAALGDCSQLTSSSYISANEVTTVASVFALAPFMTSATALGTSSSNVAGMTRAFASVHKLANIGAGSAPGDLLPSGAVAPTAEINTLANLLGACINTTGDTGAGSTCHQLFTLVTPAGGSAPTDTIGAALAIAKNPTLNVSSLFGLIPAMSPFQPALAAAPADWTLAVSYTGSFNNPATTAIDANGNIWVANMGNNTVQVLSQTGFPAMTSSLSGNGLAGPTAVAIDSNGSAWFANSTGTSLSAFTSTGTPLAGSPFTPGNLNDPISLAFDVAGDIWVANAGNNSVSELTGSGVAMGQTFSAGVPKAIAIDPK